MIFTRLNAQIAGATEGVFVPAELAVTFVYHGDDPDYPRGDASGYRIWIGKATPAAFLEGIDMWVRPAPRPPAVIPTSGLVARFHAESLDAPAGTTVTEWPALGSTHKLTATSGTPTYNRGGFGYVETDGVDDRLDSADVDRTQPHTIVMLARFKSLGDGRTLVITVTGGSAQSSFGIGAGGNRQVFAGAALNSTTKEDTNWHVHIVTFNGASSEHMVDGTVVATGNTGTNTADGVRIGCSAGGTLFFPVAVAEHACYNRALTNPEKSSITAAIRAANGIG